MRALNWIAVLLAIIFVNITAAQIQPPAPPNPPAPVGPIAGGQTVTGCVANTVLFVNAAGKLDCQVGLLYSGGATGNLSLSTAGQLAWGTGTCIHFYNTPDNLGIGNCTSIADISGSIYGLVANMSQQIVTAGDIVALALDAGGTGDTFVCRVSAGVIGLSSVFSPCNSNSGVQLNYASIGGGFTDTFLCRFSANILNVSTVSSPCNSNGLAQIATTGSLRFLAQGTPPTGNTGSCVVGTFTGGKSAGTFVAPLCASGTIILSGLTGSNGYACNAEDRTTPADLLTQTASSATSVTFTGSTALNDVVQFFCVGY